MTIGAGTGGEIAFLMLTDVSCLATIMARLS